MRSCFEGLAKSCCSGDFGAVRDRMLLWLSGSLTLGGDGQDTLDTQASCLKCLCHSLRSTGFSPSPEKITNGCCLELLSYDFIPDCALRRTYRCLGQDSFCARSKRQKALL